MNIEATGARDWKYNNNYVDNSDEYRHSKWLSFMSSRLKIAKKLNLELIDKTENDIKFGEYGLNPTAIGAGVIANIAIDDSDIIIEGDNARAEV